MLVHRLGADQDAAAPSKGHGCPRAGLTRRGESVVELTQLRDRFGAVSERDVIECGVELSSRPKVRSHLAKADDLGADGKRCKQLCALQWRCLIWERCEPGVNAALPIVRCRKKGRDREAKQATGGQGEKATHSKGRRQRRQQAKCQRCHAAAYDDCKRGIVILCGVVVHLVGGREERVEVERHGGQDGGHYWLTARGHCKAGRQEEENQSGAKGRERLQRWQHRQFYRCRTNHTPVAGRGREPTKRQTSRHAPRPGPKESGPRSAGAPAAGAPRPPGGRRTRRMGPPNRLAAPANQQKGLKTPHQPTNALNKP